MNKLWLMQFADLDLNKLYTYADYYKWQFEERVELIKGKIFKMSPAPNSYHQILAGNIHTLMNVFLWKKKCRAFIAPFDVRLTRKSAKDEDIVTVLQPDVFVVCDPSKIDYRGCVGAPDLVVEVLSPGNSSKELKNKYEVYEESGVREYWIVSPQNQTFTIYTLESGKFQFAGVKTQGDIVTTAVIPGFSLDLTELFGDFDSDDASKE